MPSLDDIYSFFVNRQWSALVLVLVAVLCWVVVRLSKDDAAPSWFAVPARWRPVLAIGLGAAAGAIYKAATSGVSWGQGLWLGLTAGIGAVMIQVFGVDVARGGKDVPLPKAMSMRPPPPPPPANGSPDETSPVDVPKFPKPPSALRRMILAAAVPLLFGCAQLHAAMPVVEDVITYVQDAEQALSSLETILGLFLATAPPATQEEYVTIDDRVHRSLDAIVRLGRAGEALDSANMQAAISDFQAAWNDLQGFVTKTGVHPHNALGAPRPPLQPLLMGVHVKGGA